MADFNVPFLSKDEARGNKLSPEEMRLLQVSHVIHNLCWVGCGIAILVLIGQAVFCMKRPYWNVDASELTTLKEQISAHNQKRAHYADVIKRINLRLRMDQVVVPLLASVQKNISLDSVNYQENLVNNAMERTLRIEGFSIEPDQDKIQTYLEQVKTSLQSALPDYTVTLNMEDTSSDPKTGNLRFSFKGGIQ